MKTLFISKSQKAWLIALGLFALNTNAQENKPEQDTIKTQSSDYKMDEVLVSAVRVDKKAPVTFTNVISLSP